MINKTYNNKNQISKDKTNLKLIDYDYFWDFDNYLYEDYLIDCDCERCVGYDTEDRDKYVIN